MNTPTEANFTSLSDELQQKLEKPGGIPGTPGKAVFLAQAARARDTTCIVSEGKAQRNPLRSTPSSGVPTPESAYKWYALGQAYHWAAQNWDALPHALAADEPIPPSHSNASPHISQKDLQPIWAPPWNPRTYDAHALSSIQGRVLHHNPAARPRPGAADHPCGASQEVALQPPCTPLLTSQSTSTPTSAPFLTHSYSGPRPTPPPLPLAARPSPPTLPDARPQASRFKIHVKPSSRHVYSHNYHHQQHLPAHKPCIYLDTHPESDKGHTEVATPVNTLIIAQPPSASTTSSEPTSPVITEPEALGFETLLRLHTVIDRPPAGPILSPCSTPEPSDSVEAPAGLSVMPHMAGMQTPARTAVSPAEQPSYSMQQQQIRTGTHQGPGDAVNFRLAMHTSIGHDDAAVQGHCLEPASTPCKVGHTTTSKHTHVVQGECNSSFQVEAAHTSIQGERIPQLSAAIAPSSPYKLRRPSSITIPLSYCPTEAMHDVPPPSHCVSLPLPWGHCPSETHPCTPVSDVTPFATPTPGSDAPCSITTRSSNSSIRDQSSAVNPTLDILSDTSPLTDIHGSIRVAEVDMRVAAAYVKEDVGVGLASSQMPTPFANSDSAQLFTPADIKAAGGTEEEDDCCNRAESILQQAMPLVVHPVDGHDLRAASPALSTAPSTPINSWHTPASTVSGLLDSYSPYADGMGMQLKAGGSSTDSSSPGVTPAGVSHETRKGSALLSKALSSKMRRMASANRSLEVSPSGWFTGDEDAEWWADGRRAASLRTALAHANSVQVVSRTHKGLNMDAALDAEGVQGPLDGTVRVVDVDSAVKGRGRLLGSKVAGVGSGAGAGWGEDIDHLGKSWSDSRCVVQ